MKASAEATPGLGLRRGRVSLNLRRSLEAARGPSQDPGLRQRPDCCHDRSRRPAVKSASSLCFPYRRGRPGARGCPRTPSLSPRRLESAEASAKRGGATPTHPDGKHRALAADNVPAPRQRGRGLARMASPPGRRALRAAALWPQPGPRVSELGLAPLRSGSEQGPPQGPACIREDAKRQGSAASSSAVQGWAGACEWQLRLEGGGGAGGGGGQWTGDRPAFRFR